MIDLSFEQTEYPYLQKQVELRPQGKHRQNQTDHLVFHRHRNLLHKRFLYQQQNLNCIQLFQFCFQLQIKLVHHLQEVEQLHH